MVNYEYSDLFMQDSIDKQLKIVTDDNLVTIANEDIHSENFELEENLCSESTLHFGSCEASVVKFKISNVFTSLKDKWITITTTLDNKTDNPFKIGRYKVFSDVPTADRNYRDVTAYDAMYDIINADVAEWYNTILPNKDSTVTLKDFRTSFVTHFGLEQEEIQLVNDDMVITKTIQPSEISGREVIFAICEINGCFGHITRDGKFRYVYLPEYGNDLYPSDNLYPSDDLFPTEPTAYIINSARRISCQYEDYIVNAITGLQIRQEENDIGAIVGSKGNIYIIEDNFLVYGKSTDDLKEIGQNILDKIVYISYRPFQAETLGNPCIEVGDAVKLNSKYQLIESYVLNRVLKGIQALRDTFTAEGEEYLPQNLNSVEKSIIQLKGKANILTRTVEETKSQIIDIENGLNTKITQNAEAIKLEAERATEEEGKLSSQIKLTAESITSTVAKSQRTWAIPSGERVELYGYGHPNNVYPETTKYKKYHYLDQTTGMLYTCAENEDGTWEWKEYRQLNSVESNLSSQITQNAESINLKVSKNNIISEINQTAETITIKANKIDLQGLVTAEQFTSKFASITSLTAVEGRIETIESNYVTTQTLEANYAKITDLNATNANVANLETGTINIATALSAAEARIGTIEADYITTSELEAEYIKASEIQADYATLTQLNAVDGKFESLDANNIKTGELSLQRIQVDNYGASPRWAEINFVSDIETKQVDEYYYITKAPLKVKLYFLVGTQLS